METHLLQGLLTHFISFLLLTFCMITSIYFNDQPIRLR